MSWWEIISAFCVGWFLADVWWYVRENLLGKE